MESFNFEVTINENKYTFLNSLSVEDLKAGSYQFCIIQDEKPSFKQCFETVIAAAVTLSSEIFVTQYQGKAIANLQIESGSPPFTIKKNNQIVGITLANSFEIDVENGDILTVETNQQCEGSTSHTVYVPSKITAFPNPTLDNVQIFIPNYEKKTVAIGVTNSSGQNVLSKLVTLIQGLANLSLKKLPQGIYFLRLEDQTGMPIKIIKN